jgi:hypothetical protein
MPTPDPEHLIAVCKAGRGKLQCRYLIAGKCLKHHEHARPVIEERSIKGTLQALGDYCEGLQPPKPQPGFLGF